MVTSPGVHSTQVIWVPLGPTTRNASVPRTAICEVPVWKV